jgi:hypothetical protein
MKQDTVADIVLADKDFEGVAMAGWTGQQDEWGLRNCCRTWQMNCSLNRMTDILT